MMGAWGGQEVWSVDMTGKEEKRKVGSPVFSWVDVALQENDTGLQRIVTWLISRG